MPSESAIRDLLMRVYPKVLDAVLQKWNDAFAPKDKSIAIDGNTMCNPIDDRCHRTHIMSAVGQESAICYTKKRAQVFLIEREVFHKKSAKKSKEIAVGLTSLTSAQAHA